jgi:hypothetical protein
MKLLLGSLIIGILMLTSPLGVSARSECARAAPTTSMHAQPSSNPCDETPGHTLEHDGFMCCVIVFVTNAVRETLSDLPSARAVLAQPFWRIIKTHFLILHPPA